MFIELVDALRCLAPHEDSWLVAAPDRMVERRVLEGTLGCPVCRRRYPIRAGVAHFADEGGEVEASAAIEPEVAPGDEQAMRLAALLDLTEPHARVLLVGGWGAAAPALVTLVPVEAVLADPPAGVPAGEGISILRAAGRIPLAPGSMRGAAIPRGASAAQADAAVAAVRGGGRVVGPVAIAPPAGLRELARDDRHWVATREAAASAPVQLRLVRKGD